MNKNDINIEEEDYKDNEKVMTDDNDEMTTNNRYSYEMTDNIVNLTSNENHKVNRENVHNKEQTSYNVIFNYLELIKICNDENKVIEDYIEVNDLGLIRLDW